MAVTAGGRAGAGVDTRFRSRPSGRVVVTTAAVERIGVDVTLLATVPVPFRPYTRSASVCVPSTRGSFLPRPEYPRELPSTRIDPFDILAINPKTARGFGGREEEEEEEEVRA